MIKSIQAGDRKHSNPITLRKDFPPSLREKPLEFPVEYFELLLMVEEGIRADSHQEIRCLHALQVVKQCQARIANVFFQEFNYNFEAVELLSVTH